ncbi:hypothetical protein ACFL4G_09510 [Thermodesulfobacteriota bacterium]
MRSGALIVMLLTLLGSVFQPVARVWAQRLDAMELLETNIHDIITMGIVHYMHGEYEVVLETFGKALMWPDLTRNQAILIHKYRGASLVKLGKEKKAISEFRMALKMNRYLTLDEKLFDHEVRSVWVQISKKPWYRRKWVWVTTAGIVGGGVALLIIEGQEESKSTSLTVEWELPTNLGE